MTYSNAGHPVAAGAVSTAAFSGLRVLVLGASGFIGRWTARALSATGATLFLAVRDRAAIEGLVRPWELRGTVLPFDATAADSADAVIRAAAPDVVFNLAGYGVDRSERGQDLMWAVNRDLVDEIAAALVRQGEGRWTGQRLVHIGSALEYGMIEGIAREDSECRPHTLYGRSKLAGTEAIRHVCRTTGLRAITARLFTVFGPGEHEGRLLPSLRQAARTGSSVAISAGTQRRDFTYVRDAVASLLSLAMVPCDPGEIVNVGTGRLQSVREFVEAAAPILGLQSQQLRFGEQAVHPDEMRIAGVDVGRLVTLTGKAPGSDIRGAVADAEAFEARRLRGPSSVPGVPA